MLALFLVHELNRTQDVPLSLLARIAERSYQSLGKELQAESLLSPVWCSALQAERQDGG
jgi:hypothetical protein